MLFCATHLLYYTVYTVKLSYESGSQSQVKHDEMDM